MTEEEIRGLAIKLYQVGLVKSYVQEHFNENSEFEVMVIQLDPHLICAKLQSRHILSKSYLLWIVFDKIQVTSWYCRCRIGSRVVGMCVHIASVLWYLAYARHLSTICPPKTCKTQKICHNQRKSMTVTPVMTLKNNIFLDFWIQATCMTMNKIITLKGHIWIIVWLLFVISCSV